MAEVPDSQTARQPTSSVKNKEDLRQQVAFATLTLKNHLTCFFFVHD